MTVERGLIRAYSGEIAASALAEQQRLAISRCLECLARHRSKTPLIFSHLTALELLGVELPRVEDDLIRGTAAHICVDSQVKRFHMRNVQSHVWSPPFERFLIDGKIWSVPPVVAWEQMAQYLSLEELVVLGDSMMRRDRKLKLVTLGELAEALRAGSSFNGVKKCREALHWMRENTDSSQETRMRRRFEDAGLHNGEINYRVYDPATDRTYYLDLAFIDLRIAFEYQGSYHEGKAQHKQDGFKREFFHRIGWTVFDVFSEHLKSAAAFSRLMGSVIAITGRYDLVRK